jgi:ABC-2 type transport system ATP-binding protein
MEMVRPQVVLQIGVAGDQQPAARLLEQHPHVQQIELRDGLVSVTLREGITDYSDFAGLLIAAGHKLTLLREDELNLETAFMALTKGITA